ncbi:hypothetical protein ACH5RR_036873 [Cinchona calisaya]|uniref:Uncharacterized protein n=1 Tax=Cinchona calisaya TaxID=153742 RepID=A0ABD2Y4I8_9GENT
MYVPKAKYSGGSLYVFDCVDVGSITLATLDSMCVGVGIQGFKRYYVLEGIKYVMLATDVAIKSCFQKLKLSSGESNLYVKVDIIEEDVNEHEEFESSKDEDYSGNETEEFSGCESYYDADEDRGNALFEANIDKGSEWLGTAHNKEVHVTNAETSVGADDLSDVDSGEKDQAPDSGSNFESVHGSNEDELDKKSIMFNPKTINDPQLEL